MIVLPEQKQIKIKQNGSRVLVQLNNQTVVELPYQVASTVGKHLTRIAAKAREFANSEQVIFDEAALIRAGAPFRLTGNPDVRDEARKEAAWNSDLRRKLPGGVKGIESDEQIGGPTVRLKQ